MSTRQRGFTLIELAIVLSLLGLLFTLLTPWRSYWQYQKYREAERGLEAAIAALEAHLLLHRSLPCAANETGAEDCSKTAESYRGEHSAYLVMTRGNDLGIIRWQPRSSMVKKSVCKLLLISLFL